MIVDLSTRSQDTSRQNRESEIFPIFYSIEDPIIEGRSTETASSLDRQGEGYGWKCLDEGGRTGMEGIGLLGDRCGHVS